MEPPREGRFFGCSKRLWLTSHNEASATLYAKWYKAATQAYFANIQAANIAGGSRTFTLTNYSAGSIIVGIATNVGGSGGPWVCPFAVSKNRSQTYFVGRNTGETLPDNASYGVATSSGVTYYVSAQPSCLSTGFSATIAYNQSGIVINMNGIAEPTHGSTAWARGIISRLGFL